jgi:hypothetical protein
MKYTTDPRILLARVRRARRAAMAKLSDARDYSTVSDIVLRGLINLNDQGHDSRLVSEIHAERAFIGL